MLTVPLEYGVLSSSGYDVSDLVSFVVFVKDAQMIKNWEDQFVGIKNINANHVKHMIRNSRVADMNFKLNIIVLFTSVMGCVKTKGTKELLKERELAEIMSEGLGKGELEGLYVEEQDDPMPENFESLQYQQEENAEIGRTSVHTEDEIKAYEGQEQSMEASDSTGGGLDSPRYHMGPQTQSPFYISVVNVDKVENNEEKRLANILFKKMAGNDSDVLFKTKYRNQSLRGQIKTLGP
ncbi:hypothetical protein Tco_0484095 [Tanacetum coccineum]